MQQEKDKHKKHKSEKKKKRRRETSSDSDSEDNSLDSALQGNHAHAGGKRDRRDSPITGEAEDQARNKVLCCSMLDNG